MSPAKWEDVSVTKSLGKFIFRSTADILRTENHKKGRRNKPLYNWISFLKKKWVWLPPSRLCFCYFPCPHPVLLLQWCKVTFQGEWHQNELGNFNPCGSADTRRFIPQVGRRECTFCIEGRKIWLQSSKYKKKNTQREKHIHLCGSAPLITYDSHIPGICLVSAFPACT